MRSWTLEAFGDMSLAVGPERIKLMVPWRLGPGDLRWKAKSQRFSSRGESRCLDTEGHVTWARNEPGVRVQGF